MDGLVSASWHGSVFITFVDKEMISPLIITTSFTSFDVGQVSKSTQSLETSTGDKSSNVF